LVEHRDISALESWIDELRPQFPTLDLEVVKILKKDHATCLPTSKIDNDLFYNYSLDGSPIYMKLAISEASNNIYTITNRYHADYGDFYNLKFIIKMFLAYCLEKKAFIRDNKDFENLISLFCLSHLEYVADDFRSCNEVGVKLVDADPIFSERYVVETNIIVDPKSLNYYNLHKYITDITAVNYDRFTGYINHNIAMKDYDTVFVKVLYSKKAYPLESYLATHLVRVGLTPALTSFREQYYRIKAALPDVSFWKRIVYTQFGFNMFAYYWLTDSRVFRSFTDEEFLKEAKMAGSDSSKYLFDKFAVNLPVKKLESLARPYKEGNFIEFVNALENPKAVTLKDTKKGKYKYLLILDKYEVFDEDLKNYFIKSDDFRVRKYSKSNFIAA